jgi:HK97 family phage major capsid protein
MANVNGTEINLMPTEGMRTEARRYRAWKEDGEAGGTDVAARRAGQILSGDELSPDLVIVMAAWFARHEVDKQGEGFSPDEDGYPSPGRVAWAAWGGDAGQTWSTAKGESIKKARGERSAESTEPAADSMAAKGIPSMDLRDLNSQPLYRSAVVADVARAEDPEVVEFTFSSEQPVERYFGMEVLSHDPEAMNMSRLNSGAAPWLWNHNAEVVLGVVERAWMGDDRRGRVRTRWSPNTKIEGSEEYKRRQDWESGTIRNVSFMYSIDAPLDTTSREGMALVTDFTPMEVSAVSIPADHTVGQGRKATSSSGPPGAAAATVAPLSHNINTEMDPSTIDMEAVRAQAAADERTRVASITSLCREHKADDLAQGLIESGASEADAMRSVLAEIAKRPAAQPATPATPARAAQPIASGGGSADIGLTEKEARSFSFVKAIRAQMMPNDRAAYEAAAFEREVSDATAQRMGVTPRGILAPNDVLSRDLTVSNASSAGDLVFTDARPGSFIELLRNRLALSTLGVTMLTGLQGPVAIPRQTGSASAYWVAEGGDPTESEPTVDQVSLVAKTLGAFTEFSRRLMLQSSIDVEQMVRTELATVIALEIDRAALYGLGSSSQPEGLKLVTGINTEDFNANNPTYAELVSMESKIAADNADIGAMSYLTNSTIYGGFKTTEKAASTAQFVLEPGGTVNGYPVVRSNQVATGDVFMGVWSQMIMGMWGSLDIQVNPYANDKSGGVRVTALQDVDVAVRHPEAFCRGNNSL